MSEVQTFTVAGVSFPVEYVYSYLVPKKEVDLRYVMAVKQLARAMLRKAIIEKGEKVENYVFRDLLPTTDLNVGTNEEWKFSVTAGENTIINITLPDEKHIVFYGLAYIDTTPRITKLEFYKGTAEAIAVFQLEPMLVQDEPVVYFRMPIIYKSGDNIVVRATATERDDAEKLVILGLVAEKKGKIIAGKKIIDISGVI